MANDDQVVLKVENVSKKFTRSLRRSMVYGSIDMFRDFIGFPSDTTKLRKSEFWSLKDINFELKKGEILGIIGENGSGKSTMLRVLNGIFPPNKGKVTIHGQIGGLIAVGSGFHPLMTGRENIYLNGTILGMTKKEIDAKFDKIVEFAEIGEFLDAPVSTYSSGMKVRLGFSIAIHRVPEILLIDEVLSVGDLSFRNKSLRRMAELRGRAKAIIFISHNLEQIKNLCSRVMVLHKGKVVFDGDPDKAIVTYEELSRSRRVNDVQKQADIQEGDYEVRYSDGNMVKINSIGIKDEQGQEISKLAMNQPLRMYMDFELQQDAPGLYFSVSVLGEKREACIWLVSNDNKQIEFENTKKGRHVLTVEIDQHHLAPGIYTPNLTIRNSATGETYERILLEKTFKVEATDGSHERGIIAVESKWKLENINN
jgi:lipopolysaccharide transport system ATP-binding protein